MDYRAEPAFIDIPAIDNDYVIIQNSIIYGNHADDFGGGIYSNDNSKVAIATPPTSCLTA